MNFLKKKKKKIVCKRQLYFKLLKIDFNLHSLIFYQNPPIWRERLSYFDVASTNHCLDTNDACLIRYVITPVLDLNTSILLGALISGDVVNGKTPIVEDPVKIFHGGLKKEAKFLFFKYLCINIMII